MSIGDMVVGLATQKATLGSLVRGVLPAGVHNCRMGSWPFIHVCDQQ